MKILYVTTVSGTMVFFPDHIKMLQDEGHTVELAANFDQPLSARVAQLGCIQHHIPFSRSVYSKDNIRAYFEIRKLILSEKFDIIHTHTPNASVLVRLACRKMRKRELKVFYTAHGFHFYKGAPLKNWLIYFPVEWVCSHWTDVLITINQEDHQLAKRQMKAKKVEYVPGVGIDINRFRNEKLNRQEKRQSLGIKENSIVLLSVGELNSNKNHEVVIRAIAAMGDMNIHFVIAGQGEKYHYLQKLAGELKVNKQVHLLGYQGNIHELYQCSDIYILPSVREGLNVSLMEAMASGLPCIVSKIRGNKDLIVEGKGGFFCCHNQKNQYIYAIKKLSINKELCKELGEYNKKRIEGFGTTQILARLKGIYNFL